MWRALATCACLTAVAAEVPASAVPVAAPVAEPTGPRVFLNDTRHAVVVGEKLDEVGFVAAHFAAFERHLEFAYNLSPLPPPKARVELVDLPGLGDIDVRVLAGQVLVSLRLGPPETAADRAASAAVQAWLKRVDLLAGGQRPAPEAWLRAALGCEALALLRPALVDLWYRDGLRAVPATLAELRAGRAPDREAFLFWRALRSQPPRAPADFLAWVAAGGVATSMSEAEWQALRSQLLLQRRPVSLGMRESADGLAALSRFVFDLGQGDVVLDGPAVARQRALPAVVESMRERLAAVRREILRQNPVHANAWRTFGAWLERFEKASPEELDRLWADFRKEQTAARELAREVEAALAAPAPKQEGQR